MVKEYIRVDKIELEMVNCPDGVCLFSKCKNCFLFEGIVDDLYINHKIIKCAYFRKLQELNNKNEEI